MAFITTQTETEAKTKYIEQKFVRAIVNDFNINIVHTLTKHEPCGRIDYLASS